MNDKTTAGPTVGLRHSASQVVTHRQTVPQLEPAWAAFVDMPEVFATAMMVGFIEQTCVEALAPYLSQGQHSVGTHVDVSHVAATPVGLTVTAEVELIEVSGRALAFRVRCTDDAGLIGEGTHRRAIIDVERFAACVAAKATGKEGSQWPRK
jgi:fluoroacetyl-CoA thioesterase